MQINYSFNNTSLLKTALTHPSTFKTKGGCIYNYERLELLGDKVLGLVITETLYTDYPHAREGEISMMVAKLVSTNTLAIIAQEIDLDQDLIMDKGEVASGGRANLNNLENAMEALIGAIFLDSDYPTIKGIIRKLWNRFLDNPQLQERDPKSGLQEWAQKRGKPIPLYKIERQYGQAHDPTFVISANIEGMESVTAIGKSKKEAEKKAAKNMMNLIEKYYNDK